ncbi:hypothetical protein B0H14DRAFT_2649435 [Mycena olivaceomarginata]|nr:hypothetical protein B0H14DRAFT_2649435 [Mycena olivaceomarginata]
MWIDKIFIDTLSDALIQRTRPALYNQLDVVTTVTDQRLKAETTAAIHEWAANADLADNSDSDSESEDESKDSVSDANRLLEQQGDAPLLYAELHAITLKAENSKMRIQKALYEKARNFAVINGPGHLLWHSESENISLSFASFLKFVPLDLVFLFHIRHIHVHHILTRMSNLSKEELQQALKDAQLKLKRAVAEMKTKDILIAQLQQNGGRKGKHKPSSGLEYDNAIVTWGKKIAVLYEPWVTVAVFGPYPEDGPPELETVPEIKQVFKDPKLYLWYTRVTLYQNIPVKFHELIDPSVFGTFATNFMKQMSSGRSSALFVFRANLDKILRIQGIEKNRDKSSESSHFNGF